MNAHLNVKVFLVTSLLILISWEAYVEYFAPYSVLRFIATYEVDKLFHVLGGAFIAGIILLFPMQFSFLRMVTALFLASILWEVFELLTDVDVTNFFDTHRILWAKDTVWDIITTILGGVVYWKVFFRRRSTNKNP